MSSSLSPSIHLYCKPATVHSRHSPHSAVAQTSSLLRRPNRVAAICAALAASAASSPRRRFALWQGAAAISTLALVPLATGAMATVGRGPGEAARGGQGWGWGAGRAALGGRHEQVHRRATHEPVRHGGRVRRCDPRLGGARVLQAERARHRDREPALPATGDLAAGGGLHPALLLDRYGSGDGIGGVRRRLADGALGAVRVLRLPARGGHLAEALLQEAAPQPAGSAGCSSGRAVRATARRGGVPLFGGVASLARAAFHRARCFSARASCSSE